MESDKGIIFWSIAAGFVLGLHLIVSLGFLCPPCT